MNSPGKFFLSLRNKFSNHSLLRQYGYLETLYPELIQFKNSGFIISFIGHTRIGFYPQNEFLLRGFEKLKFLYENRFFSKIRYSEDSSLQVVIGDISFSITTYDELYILDEIFQEGCYNFNLDKEFVVIDVGMNVGIASLYFANKKSVKKIYGFEPMIPTYEEALRNFKRNFQLASKIEAFNFGLASSDRQESWGYNPAMKGQIGYFFNQTNASLFKEVVLRKADEVLEQILINHDKELIVMKIDCEGGEYEIIPLLDEAGILKRVHLICMEWHGNRAQELIQRLQKQFTVIKNNRSLELGIIYAFNNLSS